ncbi:MAG: hypothetical protein ABH828_00775 [archaeon]
MNAFEEFLKNQERIYTKFKNSENDVKTNGIERNFRLDMQGFVISIIHPDYVNESVLNFSERIKDVSPAIIYPADGLHTTLSTYQNKEYDGTDYDKDLADKLCDSVRSVPNKQQFAINFPMWLYNTNSVFVAGYSDKIFFELGNQIHNNAFKKNITLNKQWGSHITAARFLEEKNGNELTDFFKLMEEAPVIGKSIPTHIKVGYQRITDDGFTYEPIELFPLG